MGKKRGATAAPVFPFPAAAGADEKPRRFADYGFDDDDPRLRCFSHATAKRPAAALESARFKLQKPISKKHQKQRQQQRRRRRWWSSAASAAHLFFFNRGSSSSNDTVATATVDSSSYSTAALYQTGPLYLADEEDDGAAAAACACWAPAMRSGHLAASELGASASVIQYVSLGDSRAGGAGGGGGAPPAAMPIYLVT